MVLLEAANLLHFIGIAWGVGGATVAAILMARSDKHPESAPHIMAAMPAISRLIWAGIALLIVSGIALAPLVSWPVNPIVLGAKHLVVLLLIASGLFMSFRTIPRVARLAPKDGKPSDEFLKARKTARINGTISFILWYVIVILSVAM